MNQKTYIGKRIRDLRVNKLNISAKELGSRLDPPRHGNTILSWESGRTEPDANTFINLCMVLGEDISYFYDKTEEYKNKIHDSEKYDDTKWVYVPLYGSIAAGTPIEMIAVDEYQPIPIEIHNRYPDAYLLKVVGDSMNKVLPDGCYALINPVSDIINGRAYAVCINGDDATIKRVRKLANGLELSPDSTDPTYRTKIYDYGDDNTDEVAIIGQVVYYVLPFDYII